MKIAVYTVALNEEQFVEPWFESAKEADYLLIADTGSQDGTIEKAKALGINVVSIGIKPWRFDDARNASLAAIPLDVDICVALDMDEVLVPGWRKELESIRPETTRPRYQYTWSWVGEKPGLVYGGDKIHRRQGYRWKHPVHEVIVSDRLAEVQEWIKLEIHHHPDNSKPRSQYFPLLAQSVKEDPHDDRNAFYYARELFFNNKLAEASEEFKRHLALPTARWKPERAASMRYLAKCSNTFNEKLGWWQKAILEDPLRREARLELAFLYYQNKYWEATLEQVVFVLDNLTEKPLDYLCEEFAWGAHPYDIGAIAAWNLGNPDLATEYTLKALALEPDNERLQGNLRLIKGN
jgi:glycosyltransferase involved in cell wall biosynthesis